MKNEEIQERLKKRGYFVSPLGLILVQEDNYENNLGDIRSSGGRVVISQSSRK